MIPVKSIKIQLSGMAKVEWNEQRGQYSNIYRNSEGICSVTWTIWTTESGSQQQARSAGLSAGQHEFPFKTQTPSDLALLSSFEGPSGVVRYSLIAGIAKSRQDKLEHTVAKGISVKDIVNVYVPHLMQPSSSFEQTTVRTTWHKYGSASLSATINKRGYYPGEFISTNVKVENQSTKQATAIQVLLAQIVTYNGKGPVFRNQKSHLVRNIIQRIEGSGVPAGSTGYWNNGILTVPAVPPTTNGHHIINLSYVVNVILKFYKAGDLYVQIPIVIGSTPL